MSKGYATPHVFTSSRKDVLCSEASVPVIDIMPEAWVDISALLMASPSTEFSVYGSTEIQEGNKYIVHSIIVPTQVRSSAHVDCEFPCEEHAAEVAIGRGYWTHFHSHHKMTIGFSSGDNANSSINNKAAVLLYTDKAPIGEAQVITPCGKLARADALVLVGGKDIFGDMEEMLESKEAAKPTTSTVRSSISFPDTDANMYGPEPHWMSEYDKAKKSIYNLKPVVALVPKVLRERFKEHLFFLDGDSTWTLYIYYPTTATWMKIDSQLAVEDVPRGSYLDRELDSSVALLTDEIALDLSSDVLRVYTEPKDVPLELKKMYKTINFAKGPFVARNSTVVSKNTKGIWVEHVLQGKMSPVYGKLMPGMLDAIVENTK